jgi:Dolichyl-phosphate-mannose-protein mannosyltransferase
MLAVIIEKQDQKSKTFPLMETVRLNSFFLFLFLFQILFIFQGLDVGDEGFHSTFYQQIFNDPQSVEYNFMFYMSGIIGGAWLRLFPEFGLLGLRLGGVIVTMLTIIVTYKLLKNHIRDSYLKLGLLLLVLLNGSAVKDLSYNNISALFLATAIWFLFQGIQKNKNFNFFVSGIFLALTTFSRLSNVAGLSLVIVIAYSGFFVYRKTIVNQVTQAVFFVSGFAISVLVILGMMKFLGHYEVFINSLKLLKDIAASKENTHGLSKIVNTLIRDYSTAIFKRTLPLGFIVFLCAAVANYFKRNEKVTRFIQYFFSVVFILSLLALIFTRGTLPIWIFIVLLFAALSLIATFSIIFKRNDNELRIISLAGTIMTLTLIAGSDFGIPASGSTALWIGMPIATDFFLRIFFVSVKGSFASRNNSDTKELPRIINLSVSDKQLQGIWKWGIYACMILLVIHTVIYTYNDHPNRLKMTYSVNNAFLKGVFTTRERAKAVNELLVESSKYIKPDDYVIAYEDIPMFYTLTRTRPYIKNSWPRLYDRATLEVELNTALTEKQILPLVVYQKVQTLPGPYWPDLNQDNSSFDMNRPKNAQIKKFLTANNYKMVWENIAFRIYLAKSLGSVTKQ